VKPLETVYWLRLAFGILAALVCIGYLFGTGTISTNLVLNRSVEAADAGSTAPQDWSFSGNGTEWSTAYSRTQSRSLGISVDNSSAEWKGKVKPVNEGSTYQTSGYFRGEVVSDQFLLTTRWFSDSAGVARIAENNFSIPVGNYSQWQFLEGVSTAPSGAKSCEIVFRAVHGSGDLYGDDFEIRQTESITKFFNSMSLATLIYLGSYFVIKRRFLTRVEKPTKLLTTGIGIYFISWAVFWVLIYTTLAV
jgi:hypothetical protein